jgi:DNA-binding XRE family transcriptional regulator
MQCDHSEIIHGTGQATNKPALNVLGPTIEFIPPKRCDLAWRADWLQQEVEFGALLRSFRDRLTPEMAGVRPTPPTNRRVPGLRRDELAGLAGVSEEHLRRLEQGRRRPSRLTVDALARALRLDRHGHARLAVLAGFAAPDRE